MTHRFQRASVLCLVLMVLFALLAGSVERSQAVSQPGIAPSGFFANYTFNNVTPITIQDGSADVYPSNIAVSGVAGIVTSVSVILFDFNHSFADDVDILLVAPSGARLTLVSDVGFNGTFSGDHTIQDGGTPYDTSLTNIDQGTGTYAPTNRPASICFDEIPDPDVFDAPAPAGPYDSTTTFAASFNGLSGAAVNGTWSLYVMDDCGGDNGTIGGGWRLTISDTPIATNPLSASASCNGTNLAVNIASGDGPFNITGTGPDLPQNGVGIGTTTITGPGSWTGVTVTETTGDLQTQVLGSFDCTPPPVTLSASASCNGTTLEVNIATGDAPFNITGTGPNLPQNGVGLGITSLAGPGTWTGLTVTETTGDTQSQVLGIFSCNPPPAALSASATCDDTSLEVTIVTGDGPFNITGTGPNLPQNGVGIGITSLAGPGTWTGVTVTETTGDTQSQVLGTFSCNPPPVTLSASATCNGTALEVNIATGDAPFNITGTGPNLPQNGVGIGVTSLAGPGTWTGVTVTETTGDTQSQVLGDFSCNPPPVTLSASATCNGTALEVTIATGDAPFNITGTGPNLPQNGVGIGITSLAGPGSWTGLTVTETTGDLQTQVLGTFSCNPPPVTLSASATCNGTALEVNIATGDAPFNITGTGPNLPQNGVGIGITSLAGPGTWTGVTVTETTGDTQSQVLGTFSCNPPPVTLSASATCNGTALEVNIATGDAPFNITGTGPNLPQNGVGLGITSLTGPGSWTGLTVTETTGDTQSQVLGTFSCNPPPVTLSASATCNGTALEVNIATGDAPFNITGTGPNLPQNGVGIGITSLAGPGTWTGVTVTETTGDTQSQVLGTFSCNPPPVTLSASATCNGTALEVNIATGDAPFNITGTGPNLPQNGVGLGITSLAGPGTWTGVTVTETTGDLQSQVLGTFSCNPPPVTLSALATCNGTALEVNIATGDAPFNITGTGPGLPQNGVNLGITTLAGPGMWIGVTVTETTGDTQSQVLGTFSCNPPPVTLSASATCNGTVLEVTIATGDAPFNITGTGPNLPQNGVNLGITTLAGPGSWTGLTVTETGGDLQTQVLGDFSCNAPPAALNASAICNGAVLAVAIVAGDAPFNITGTGPGLPQNGVGFGTTNLIGPGDWTGVTVSETGGNLESVTLGDFNCTGTVIVLAGIEVPHLGLVMIDLGRAQAAYQEPGGDSINGIVLPADYDSNGFDTYIVTDIVWREGEYWLGLFLGSTNWGYVPLDQVIPLSDLPLPTPPDSDDASGKVPS